MPQKVLSIRIDGELVKAAEGQTILQAARSSSKYIPTLCWLEGLDAVGACRLCIVEVSGVGRLLPACTTPVQDGMSVTTNSPKLQRYRRLILELLFVERNHVCAVCVSNGRCELQTLAYSHGMEHVRYEYTFPKWSVDNTHNLFGTDHNRCVLCSRCVDVCPEYCLAIVPFESLDLPEAERGELAARAEANGLPLSAMIKDDDRCIRCGLCAIRCPTDAMTMEKFQILERFV